MAVSGFGVQTAKARQSGGPSRFGLLAILVLVGAITGAVYSPGLSGGFVLDDHANIVDQRALHIDQLSPASIWRAVARSMRSAVGRPLPLASLAIQHGITGLAPRPLLIANVALHLLAFGVIAWVTWLLVRLTDLHWAWAPTIAGLWALHPMNLTGVLYIVQRMTSMEAIFAFLVIGTYLRYRIRGRQDSRTYWLPVAVVGSLACLALLS